VAPLAGFGAEAGAFGAGAFGAGAGFLLSANAFGENARAEADSSKAAVRDWTRVASEKREDFDEKNTTTP
jgi:hypothetical protein